MNDATASDVVGVGGTPLQNVVREAVGVFDSPARLEAAVEQLGAAGRQKLRRSAKPDIRPYGAAYGDARRGRGRRDRRLLGFTGR